MMSRSRSILLVLAAIGLSMALAVSIFAHRAAKTVATVDGVDASVPPLEAVAQATPVTPTRTRLYVPKEAGARPVVVPSAKQKGKAPAPRVVEPVQAETWVQIELDDAGKPNLGSCLRDSDCPVKQACTVNLAAKRLACMPAECTSDEDCPGDSQCRTAGTDHSALRCVKGGDRYDGDRCSPTPFGPSDACQLGLVCHRGRCGTPCDKASPTSCKAGSECVDSPDGPACTLKSCRTIGCPGGERCTSINRTDAACMRSVAGEDCFARPCPTGQACAVYQWGATIGYQCAKPCTPMDPASCGKGEVCGYGGIEALSVCYTACAHPKDCGEGFVCATVTEDLKTKGCKARYREAM